jgi:hypothetical protein
MSSDSNRQQQRAQWHERLVAQVRIPALPVTNSCSSRSVILVDAGRVGECWNIVRLLNWSSLLFFFSG